MNIIKVSPRGYCKGVVRAISIAKQCRERYPDQPITVLGMLVHNEYVKNALALRGIRTIEETGCSCSMKWKAAWSSSPPTGSAIRPERRQSKRG